MFAATSAVVKMTPHHGRLLPRGQAPNPLNKDDMWIDTCFCFACLCFAGLALLAFQDGEALLAGKLGPSPTTTRKAVSLSPHVT